MDLMSVSENDLNRLKTVQNNANSAATADDFLPWAEKYRPKKLDDIILPVETREILRFAIETAHFQHMILHSGKPGSGKSTVAKVIPEEMGVDYLFLPIARRSTEILDMIADFAVRKSIDGRPRFVILDEADRPSGPPDKFYSALQPLIESTSLTLRYILTCNNLHRIPEAIRSRCTPISFAHDTNDKKMKRALWERVQYIANKEVDSIGGTVDLDTLGTIVKSYYPDMRAIMGSMMMTWLSGRGSIIGTHAAWTSEQGEKVWAMIQAKQDLEARKWISENVLDYLGIYRQLGDLAIDALDQRKRLKFATLLAEYQYRSSMPAVDQEVNLWGFVAETIQLMHY